MAFATDSSSPLLKPIPGIVRSIGSSGVMLVDWPTGSTYSAITLYCTIGGVAATRAQIEAMLTNWRFTLSGVEKWNLTGLELIADQEFEHSGIIGDTGYITISFERLQMSSLAGQIGPNYGTLGESSMRLEITQTASTIDAVSAWAIIQPQAEPLGAHMITRKFNVQAGAGVNTYTNFPIFAGSGEHLYSLGFEVPTVADLTNIAIIADNARIVDVQPLLLKQWYKLSNPARNEQTAKKIIYLPFDMRNLDSDALPLTMSQLLVETTFANSPTTYNLIAKIQTGTPPILPKA